MGIALERARPKAPATTSTSTAASVPPNSGAPHSLIEPH